MPPPTLGIGLIGCGRAGLIHGRNFARAISGARLLGLADAHPETLAAARAELGVALATPDYRDLLARDDIHAVVIATPTSLHREIAVAAAAAGKHILCEKPLAMSEDECDAMIAAAARARVYLQVGFMRRFDTRFQTAWQRVQDGAIGQVVAVRSITCGPSHPRPWMFDLRQSNGPLAEVNSHDIDTLRWFTGAEFARLWALGGNYRCPEARAAWPDFYDNVLLMASFTNGCQGSIGGAQGVQYGYDARVEVLGTTGLVLLGRIQEEGLLVISADGHTSGSAISSWRTLFLDAYRAEDQDFVDCIREERPPRVTGEDGKQAVRVVLAGNRSIVTGEFVDLATPSLQSIPYALPQPAPHPSFTPAPEPAPAPSLA